GERYAARKALSMGILQRILGAVLDNSGSLRSKRLVFGLQAPKYVQNIFVDVVSIDLQNREPFAENALVFGRRPAFHIAQSRKIRLAVESWRGRCEVGLAVFCTRSARVRVIQPLRMRVRECPGKQDSEGRALKSHGRNLPSCGSDTP